MTQTTEQVKDMNRNPDGNGGFADNPENINTGGRPKNQESFAYWMNFFKNLPVKEFLAWLKDNPEETRIVAADLAYSRVFNARKELAEFKEVADRTEGKAKQPIQHLGDIKRIEEIVDDILKDDTPEQSEENPKADK